MAKKSPSGGRGRRGAARRADPDPDLRAAKRHLAAALAALGGGDPAARMARSALENVEVPLSRASTDAARPLELRRAANGKWQVWSGLRVMRAYSAQKKRPLLDRTGGSRT